MWLVILPFHLGVSEGKSIVGYVWPDILKFVFSILELSTRIYTANRAGCHKSWSCSFITIRSHLQSIQYLLPELSRIYGFEVSSHHSFAPRGWIHTPRRPSHSRLPTGL